MKMRQEIVGVYECGYDNVQIVLREGSGGEMIPLPGDILCPRIKIGADERNWSKFLGVVVHEVMEFALERERCRFYPSNDISGALDSAMFSANHYQFSNACACCGDLLGRCHYDLARAWKAWAKKSTRKIER